MTSLIDIISCTKFAIFVWNMLNNRTFTIRQGNNTIKILKKVTVGIGLITHLIQCLPSVYGVYCHQQVYIRRQDWSSYPR